MLKKSFRPYLLTLIAVFGMASSSIGVIQNSVGVFFLPVTQSLGFGIGAFAFHATLSNVLTGLSSPFSLKLLRKGHFVRTMRFGILVASLSTILMAYSTQLWHFYLLGVLRGVGSSFFALAPIMYILGNWFEVKQGLAMGLAMSFSGLVGALFNPLLNELIGIIGWQNAYLLMGTATFITAFTGTFWLKPVPSHLGLLAYGAKPKEVIEVVHEKPHTAPKFNLLFISLALFALLAPSLSAIVQHFPAYTKTLGQSSSVGALMVSSAMVGNVIFKLVIGWLSDRFGQYKAVLSMFSISFISLVLLNLLANTLPWVLILIAFMYGSIYAVAAVGIPLLTKFAYPGSQSAQTYAYLSPFVSIGSALTIYILGFFYDTFNNYSFSLHYLLVVGSIALILIVSLKIIHQRTIK